MVIAPDSPDPADGEVSHEECWAWRILSNRGEYTISEIAFMFEYGEKAVGHHVSRRCRHSIGEYSPSDPRKQYSDRDLLLAFRLIHEKQPYDRMSQQVYEEHRPDHFPSAATIRGRFDSWKTARERALGDD